MDLLEYPAEIKNLCERITLDFIELYDFYYDKLSKAGMPSTTWMPVIARGKMHIPSCDFSCMISSEMFEEMFLPSIIKECKHMDRCIYHLDGPNALRYLDRLLEIPQIHAIQWVAGAGKDNFADSIDVYKKIQKANKAFVVYPKNLKETSHIIEILKPNGVWMDFRDIENMEMAETALNAIKKWGR